LSVSDDTGDNAEAETPEAATPEVADASSAGGAPTAAAVLSHIVTSIVDDPNACASTRLPIVAAFVLTCGSAPAISDV